MSPVIVGAIARTAACAWVSEHGCPDEHAVPVPDGAAKRVVVAADAAEAATTTAVTARPVAAASATADRFTTEDEDRNIGVSSSNGLRAS
jgi:hypothetical protein